MSTRFYGVSDDDDDVVNGHGRVDMLTATVASDRVHAWSKMTDARVDCVHQLGHKTSHWKLFCWLRTVHTANRSDCIKTAVIEFTIVYTCDRRRSQNFSCVGELWRHFQVWRVKGNWV